MVYAQDYDFLSRISRYGKIANIQEILLQYRVHSQQISIEKHNEQLCYANITRKRMLEELQIFVSEEEFIWWSRFCRLDFHDLRAEERSALDRIVNKIIRRNTKLEIYNPDKLRKRLKERLKYFLQKSDNASITYSFNVREQNKYSELFQMMCQWTMKRESGKCIGTYLKKQGFREVAIYGMGDLGCLLVPELKGNGINVKYGIDSDINVPYLVNNLKIYHVEEKLEQVDAIIVTPITYFSEINNLLHEKLNCEILPLDKIIYEL